MGVLDFYILLVQAFCRYSCWVMVAWGKEGTQQLVSSLFSGTITYNMDIGIEKLLSWEDAQQLDLI